MVAVHRRNHTFGCFPVRMGGNPRLCLGSDDPGALSFHLRARHRLPARKDGKTQQHEGQQNVAHCG